MATLSLLIMALLLMGSPGPATLSVTAMAATFGPRRALPFYFGIVSGTGTVLLVVASGVGGLLFVKPELTFLVSLAAAFYILYLAYRLATAPPLDLESDSQTKAPGFLPAWLLAIANPKAYAAIGAVYASQQLADSAVWDGVLKVTLLTLVIIGVNIVWLLLGSLFRRYLANPRSAPWINRGFAAALIISVVLALL